MIEEDEQDGSAEENDTDSGEWRSSELYAHSMDVPKDDFSAPKSIDGLSRTNLTDSSLSYSLDQKRTDRKTTIRARRSS